MKTITNETVRGWLGRSFELLKTGYSFPVILTVKDELDVDRCYRWILQYSEVTMSQKRNCFQSHVYLASEIVVEARWFQERIEKKLLKWLDQEAAA